MIEVEIDMSPEPKRKRSKRAAAARNERGSAADRLRRRQWVLETYRANVDGIIVRYTRAPEREDLSQPILWLPRDQSDYGFSVLLAELEEDPVYEIIERQVPLCRCYRCGRLLTLATLTIDRIIPGRAGGTYRRDNIRPACISCNKARDHEAVPHH